MFLPVCHGILWPVAALTICAKASGLIASERSRQTLDVLLTTPITVPEFVRQKMLSVYRLTGVFLVIFSGLALLESMTVVESRWPRRGQPIPLAFAATVITPAVYLPMLGWLSLTIGLKAKSVARATIASVSGVVCRPDIHLLRPFQSRPG